MTVVVVMLFYVCDHFFMIVVIIMFIHFNHALRVCHHAYTDGCQGSFLKNA